MGFLMDCVSKGTQGKPAERLRWTMGHVRMLRLSEAMHGNVCVCESTLIHYSYSLTHVLSLEQRRRRESRQVQWRRSEAKTVDAHSLTC